MKLGRNSRRFARLWMLAIFGFLYLPIVSLVVFSFTDSSVPNVWGGFSLRWYIALTTDTDLKESLWLSLKIATCTATAAVILGSLAAASLHRYPRFFGSSRFTGERGLDLQKEIGGGGGGGGKELVD